MSSAVVVGMAMASSVVCFLWKEIMRDSRWGFLLAGVLLTAICAIASADDAKDGAIKKGRKQLEGIWRVVSLESDGNKVMDDDAKKLKVVIGEDGSWSLTSEEKDVTQGTSTIDPTKTPKTIDFTVTAGDDKGKQSLGIYEVGENTVKFCVAPSGKERPTEFSSTSGSQHILLAFERVKAK